MDRLEGTGKRRFFPAQAEEQVLQWAAQNACQE
jgi:hypothetical protein